MNMGGCSSTETSTRNKRHRGNRTDRSSRQRDSRMLDDGRSRHRGSRVSESVEHSEPLELKRTGVYSADLSQFEGPTRTYKPEYINTNRVPLRTGTVIERPVQFKQASYVGIYNVTIHHHDKKDCRIRGAEFLPNGTLVVCDQANCTLKLWSATFQYLNHLQLPGNPHDLCVHSSNKEGSDIFVTIPSNRCILEFFVEEKSITPGAKIRTDGWCYGIAPYKAGLVVCIGTKIVFLDPNGNQQQFWQYDEDGSSRFGSPFHIIVTPSNQIVVSDSMRGHVLGLSPDGEELFRYEAMTTPHDLMADSLGNIFLCGADENSVDALHQITRDGEKVKSLLSWRHVGFKPDTLCFRERDQILAVFGESNRMKTFKLTTRRAGKMYSNDAIMNDVEEENQGSRTIPEVQGPRTTPEVQALMKKIYSD